MRRKRNNFKFTKKTRSKRGIRSCVLSVASIAVMGYMFFDSFSHVKSLGEEDSFKGIPVAAAILSFLATGAWGTIYAAGFLL